MFGRTYAWALRRVFRFVLRRALGKALKNEGNLEQLDVALGSGTAASRPRKSGNMKEKGRKLTRHMTFVERRR
jgi:hypothetical protein